MKINNTKIEGSKATVEMTLTYETLEQAKSAAYAKAKKNIMLPGFRKGHAPRKMVESMYGPDVFLEDAIEEIFPKIFDSMTDSGLKIVGTPSITLQPPYSGSLWRKSMNSASLMSRIEYGRSGKPTPQMTTSGLPRWWRYMLRSP